MTISADEITAWLARTGYPLEMSVAREFRKVAPFADQSRYYRDINSNEYREIDVVASVSAPGHDGWTEFFFVVECKSNNVPWVIFVDADGNSDPFGVGRWLDLLPSAGQDEDTACRLMNRATDRRVPLLKSANPPGYGIVAKRDEDKQGARDKNRASDGPYDAVRQAASASLSIVKERNAARSGQQYCSFAVPIVVTKSPIFEAWLGRDGKVSAQEVKRSSVLTHMGTNSGLVLVYIWSHEFVNALTEECIESAQAFFP